MNIHSLDLTYINTLVSFKLYFKDRSKCSYYLPWKWVICISLFLFYRWDPHMDYASSIDFDILLPTASSVSALAAAQKRSTVKSDRYNHSVLELKVTGWIQLAHPLYFPCEETIAANVASMVNPVYLHLFEDQPMVRMWPRVACLRAWSLLALPAQQILYGENSSRKNRE